MCKTLFATHEHAQAVYTTMLRLRMVHIICARDGVPQLVAAVGCRRLQLPADLIGKFSLNVLEFAASVVTIQMVLVICSNCRILAVIDSTGALG